MNIHNKDTALKMAASAALRLHYWADHPLAGRIWAVDDNQQPHVLRIYKKDMKKSWPRPDRLTVALQTVSVSEVTESSGYPFYRKTTKQKISTWDSGPAIDFAVDDSTQDLFKVAA